MNVPVPSIPRKKYETLKGVVRRGVSSFVETGTALAEINASRAYLYDEYTTFAEFCRAQYAIAPSYAYRQIEAAEVARLISPMGDIRQPLTERTCREMVPLLPAGESEGAGRPVTRPPDDSLFRKAWNEITRDVSKGANLTAALVKKHVKALTPTPPPPPLPTGQYRVLLADPPWQYDNSGFEQSAAQHYPTMPIEAIADLAVPAAPDAVLFLWATSPLLPEALRVMAVWGFEYKSSFVWVKDKAPGIGWFVRTRHELLLIGIKGEPGHPAVKPDSVLDAKVSAHSRKPDEQYSLVESMYSGPYVELFARRKRDGWESWGNDVL